MHCSEGGIGAPGTPSLALWGGASTSAAAANLLETAGTAYLRTLWSPEHSYHADHRSRLAENPHCVGCTCTIGVLVWRRPRAMQPRRSTTLPNRPNRSKTPSSISMLVSSSIVSDDIPASLHQHRSRASRFWHADRGLHVSQMPRSTAARRCDHIIASHLSSIFTYDASMAVASAWRR